MLPLKVERPATRTEGRSRERMCARRDAMMAIAFLARIVSEHAIQARRRRRRATQTYVAPDPHQASAVSVTATMERAVSLRIASASLGTLRRLVPPAKSEEERAS